MTRYAKMPRPFTTVNACSDQENRAPGKQARAFFDSWLERFTTWDDFVQGVGNNPLPEFGDDHETAIQQITNWLVGAAKATVPFFYRGAL